MKPLPLLFALTLIASLHAGPKADFFVSPNGNDAWSGRFPTPSADKSDGPFATLAKARDAVRRQRQRETLNRPVEVLVLGGRYELTEPLTFTPADSGTEKSPTIFVAIPGEPVILSGGVRVRNGEEKEGVYRYPLPKGIGDGSFRQISVNGEWRSRPRLPKEGFYTIAGLAGADPKGKYDTKANKFEFKAGEIDANWKNLADVEAVVLHFWVDTHLKIASVDPDKRVVTFDRYSRRKFTDDYQNRLARYYLTNVFEALGPSEFYHDRSTKTLHYKPKPGEDMARAEVVVPRLGSVLSFDGGPESGKSTEWVEFRGFTISDTTWEPPAGDAADGQAASNVAGAVRFRGARHCTFTDGTVRNVGGYGFEIAAGCDHIRILGNEITRAGAGGIKLSGGGANSKDDYRTGECVMTDNHIHHLGEIFHSGVGVLLMHADRCTIAHNHIHHLYYTGISVGWVWGYGPSVSKENKIENNHIHDIGQKLLSDMGGVYLLGVSPGTVVRGNHIHDVDSWSYGGWGIYTDEGSAGITIENNLVYRTKSGGFHQHYGKDNVVRNNIFALAREEQIARSRAEPHTSFTFERNVVYWTDGPLFGHNWKDNNFVVDHNVYWNAAGKPVEFPGGSLDAWQKRGHDKNTLIADPKFREPKKGDFSFVDESVVKKIGFVPFDVSKAGVRPREKRQ
jgi:parallel beta-helix repeat protein